MRLLGIDPGYSGGLAIIDHEGACMTIEMPTIGEGKQRLIDGTAVQRWVNRNGEPIDFAVIEEVTAMRGWGLGSTFRFGCNYGVVLGALQTMHIPFAQVRPTVWKKSLGLIKADKSASRALALELWPHAADQFKRAKDDGRAEAALIAKYWLSSGILTAPWRD